MKNVIGHGLVAAAALLGAYACYLFEARVKEGLAHEILDWFV